MDTKLEICEDPTNFGKAKLLDCSKPINDILQYVSTSEELIGGKKRKEEKKTHLPYTWSLHLDQEVLLSSGCSHHVQGSPIDLLYNRGLNL